MEKELLFLIIIIIVLIASISIYRSRDLKRTYTMEVLKGIRRTALEKPDILKEEDIRHLPEPVQRYIRYSGAIGREKVKSIRAVVGGKMKLDPRKDFVEIKAQQYNFFDRQLTRLFYMKAAMFGIPFLGLHSYKNDGAYMHIKVLGLFTVLNSRGPEMRIADTTTLLNDMCFFAPATLIDKRITWETIDSLTAKATFENDGTRISAVLYFNDKGELTDFISSDRYYMPLDGSSRKAVWSTPITGYQERNGIKIPAYGEAVWKLPEGDYCYAKFTDIKELEYNCKRIV